MQEFQALLDSKIIGNLEVISALNQELGFGFEIYFTNRPRLTYLPRYLTLPTLKLYHYADTYDSILRSEDATIKVNLATWNLRGARTTEKQFLIDEHAHHHNLDVIICMRDSSVWAIHPNSAL